MKAQVFDTSFSMNTKPIDEGKGFRLKTKLFDKSTSF